MIKKRRKPDFIFVLAVIVSVGVILTMKVQAGAGQPAQNTAISAKPVMLQSAQK